MLKSNRLLAAVLMVALLSTGCDSDESDAPDRRELLTGERWYTQSAEVVDPNSDLESIEVPAYVEFEPGGTLRAAPVGSGEEPATGEWRFTNDQETVVAQVGAFTVEYDILELTEEQLRYRYPFPLAVGNPLIEVELTHTEQPE